MQTTSSSTATDEYKEYYLGEGVYMDFPNYREYLIAKSKMFPKEPLPTPVEPEVITTSTSTFKPYEFTRNVMKQLDFAKCMQQNVLHKAEHKKNIIRKFANRLIFSPLYTKKVINTNMDIRKHIEKVIFREITTIKSKEDQKDIRDEIYEDCKYVFGVHTHEIEFKKDASLKRMLTWVDKYAWCFIDMGTCYMENSVSPETFKTLFDLNCLYDPVATELKQKVSKCNRHLMIDEKIWKYCYYKYKCINNIK